MSASERLQLIQTLNQLPASQFEELVIALNPPAGILPPNVAAQGPRLRATTLGRGTDGPQLPQLQAILQQLLPADQSFLDGDNPTRRRCRPPGSCLSQATLLRAPKAQLEAALAAVEADLETAPRQVDRLRLEKEAEQLLDKIEALDNTLNG
ncbi:hypothetical protein XM38_036850 [Halomicronema hongdechloris C2206]|uniref:Uncharacterized protein n=1 Tax=Halomicronema hongdechloris C2206 TaxID=1641165 RepID=A0A1Z3HRG0_9CYAN|nr:hypothetical protein [Halomicronema hongdechloris]ASC72727.1 hypothetical protein XM38_036850 [Halomicronema hongdechloris C2206]